MKALIITLGLVTAGHFAFAQKATTLNLNSTASSLTWVGKKISGEHTGAISPAKGTFTVEKGKLAAGELAIDMSTITCTDMEGEYRDKLIGHLHSDDFFSTSKFPVATLKITKVEPIKNAGANKYNHNVTGELTIKGETHPITFPAFIEVKDNKMAAAGELKVDRTKYGIKYGSASFFEGLGDKAIDNDFIIKFTVGANS